VKSHVNDLFAKIGVRDCTLARGFTHHDGGTVTADELARVTASTLDPEFCRVLSTEAAIAELNATG
jgi:hypothetical protein